MNVLINYSYYPEKTVHIDNRQCYTLIQSKKRRKKKKIHFQILFNTHFLSYAVFITTFILSICACDEPMWQSQTYKHARHFFFSIFFLPLSLLSWVLFRLRRRMTMQHRAISIGRTYSTLTLFFFFFFFFFYDSLSLSSASSIVYFVLFFFFAHTDIVLISGIFVRLLMLLVMT